GTVGIRSHKWGIHGADDNPRARARCDIPEEPCRPRNRRHKQIQNALVAEVAAGEAPAYRARATQRLILQRQIPESSRAIAGEQLVPLVELIPKRSARRAANHGRVLYTPVCQGEIECAVEIEVPKHRAKARAAPSGACQSRGRGLIVKLSGRALLPKDVQLLRQMGNE